MSYRCCEVFVYCKGWLHETAGRDEKFRQLKLRQKVMYAPLFPARLVLSFRCDAPRTSFFPRLGGRGGGALRAHLRRVGWGGGG